MPSTLMLTMTERSYAFLVRQSGYGGHGTLDPFCSYCPPSKGQAFKVGDRYAYWGKPETRILVCQEHLRENLASKANEAEIALIYARNQVKALDMELEGDWRNTEDV